RRGHRDHDRPPPRRPPWRLERGARRRCGVHRHDRRRAAAVARRQRGAGQVPGRSPLAVPGRLVRHPAHPVDDHRPGVRCSRRAQPDHALRLRKTGVILNCRASGSAGRDGEQPVFPNPFDDRPSRVKTKAATTYALLIAANVAAWMWAWLAFAERPVLLGTAFLAYIFGLRHAFDADHIAAIDNVVRKLMQGGKSPYSVGFFFSLGHSSIVVLASIAIAATATAFRGRLAALHEVGGMIGTFASASFLLIIGIANLFILRGVWAAFIRVRAGETVSET